MIRFFVRLAIAALADWLTWQISTPEMRFERVTRKHRRAILRVIEAATPAVEEFYSAVFRTARAFVEWAEECQVAFEGEENE